MSDSDNSNNSKTREAIYPDIMIEEKEDKITGDKILKQYKKGKLLGKGGFAKCFEIVDNNNNEKKISAVKVIPKNNLSKQRAKQKLISEIKIHKNFRHENIVQFEHVFEDHHNIYIILEVCTNQTLSELLKRRKKISELETQYYIYQVCSAIKYVHSKNIIHRDLKLGNLFLTHGLQVRVGDFGLAAQLDYVGQKKKTVCGTPNYIAPEILIGKTGHSYEVDVWSIGVIIYTMLYGKPPFETSDVKQTYERIKEGSYEFPSDVNVSYKAKDLIQSILKLKPQERPTLDEILNSEFLTSNDLPKEMPLYSLAMPLKQEFLDQFQQRQSMKRSASTPFKAEKILNRNENVNKALFQKDMNINSKEQIKQSFKFVYVLKWVDFSEKYGLGYQLSNGSTGVIYNDGTKMIISQDKNGFEYLDIQSDTTQQQSKQFDFNTYPKDLKKKTNLLLHFKAYLNQNSQNNFSDEVSQKNKNKIQIKNWLRTKEAIFFRLTNKIIQINFTDKTQIIMDMRNRQVIYKDKNENFLFFEQHKINEIKDKDILKRLKYLRSMFSQLMEEEEMEGDKKIDKDVIKQNI